MSPPTGAPPTDPVTKRLMELLLEHMELDPSEVVRLKIEVDYTLSRSWVEWESARLVDREVLTALEERAIKEVKGDAGPG